MFFAEPSGIFDLYCGSFLAIFDRHIARCSGGGLSWCVKSKPLGNGQIISIDVLVFVMIIAVFHEKLI